VKADISAAGSFALSSAGAIPGEIMLRQQARDRIASVFTDLFLISESSLIQVISIKKIHTIIIALFVLFLMLIYYIFIIKNSRTKVFELYTRPAMAYWPGIGPLNVYIS
jgi:hypothetical protein